MTDSRLAIVVLAAGQGTRMKSSRPKVLHELAGVPLPLSLIEEVEEVGKSARERMKRGREGRTH